MKQLFAHRGFRRLMIGQTVSSLGDWLGTIALIALVLDLTGSSTAVGGVLVLRLAPSLVAGPLVTRLVGRWNRRRTMLAMDAIRVGVVVLVPLIGALWWVYVWAFVLEVAGPTFPTIICGDFNAPPDADELRMLTGRAPTAAPDFALFDAWEMAGAGSGHTWARSNPWTVPVLLPDRRIDYVLVGRPRRGGAGHVPHDKSRSWAAQARRLAR